MLISYNEAREWVTEPDPTDKWDAGHDRVVLVLGDVYLERRDDTPWLVEEFACPHPVLTGDKVWLVVARYYDGGTFGGTSGLWQIVEVAASAKDAQDISAGVARRPGPWKGYFASLEDVEIHERVVV